MNNQKTNDAVHWAVDEAVRGIVDGTVWWHVVDAVSRDVYWAVFGAVDRSVDNVVRGAVDWAGVEDPPRPALQDFLGALGETS